MKILHTMIFPAALAAVLVGCGGSATAPATAPEPSAAAGAGAAPEAKAAPAPGLPLEIKSNDAFQISLPKGSKRLDPGAPVKGLLQETYEYALDDHGANALNISVATSVGVESLDDAVRDATMMGSKDLTEKKELAAGSFLVVKAPEGTGPMASEEVYVFRHGKDGALRAKCSGPATYKDTLVEICSSLKLKG